MRKNDQLGFIISSISKWKLRTLVYTISPVHQDHLALDLCTRSVGAGQGEVFNSPPGITGNKAPMFYYKRMTYR